MYIRKKYITKLKCFAHRNHLQLLGERSSSSEGPSNESIELYSPALTIYKRGSLIFVFDIK